MTLDQEYCRKALSRWSGGDHHLPKVYEFGVGICINHHGDLSTFDFDRLSQLVLIAHRYRVRIEIDSSCPGMVKIIAHRRKEVGSLTVRHPSLSELQSSAESAKLWPDL